MRHFVLFIIPAGIWGSTWLAIKFQVGEVDPMVSVAYRFLIAGMLLIAYCLIRKLPMKFKSQEHFFILLQGLFIFGFNYWLVYMAELHLTSGLVGLLFSTLVFMNILNSRIFLKTPFEPRVLIGGAMGLGGMALVFQKDLIAFSFSSETSVALLLALSGAYVASLGNITSARNQMRGIPVLQSNAVGMMYGGIAMAVFSLLSGKPFTYEPNIGYLFSLGYLAVFGSVFAFTAYLTLVGEIGASRAGYVTLISPIIALTLSTFFEDYRWSAVGLLGVVLILGGNALVLRMKGSGKPARLAKT
jgi:drug/metabolite transporter (DMT)-like permease